MLDALRQHKPPSPNPDAPASRGVSTDSVPATLAFPVDREPQPGSSSSGKRLGLAVVLVGVTGILLWQVAAINGLLPSWPIPRLFKPGAASPSPPKPGSTVRTTAGAPARSAPAPQAVAEPAHAADLKTPAPAAAQGSSPPELPRADAGRAPVTRLSSGGEKPAAPQPTVPGRPASSVLPPAGPAPLQPNGGAIVAPAGGPAGAAVSRATAGETDHFKLAIYYQRVGDFENSLVHYRAVLAANELNAEAHNNLGVLYQSKGLFEEAIREFQRATFIDPRYDKAHNNLGVALLRSGKTDASIAEFRSIVAQDPKNVEVLTNLSLALKAAGRAEEARETLQRVLGINGRYAQAHYNLALLYEERGEFQRAIDHFEQFLANAGPDSAALTVEVRARVQALRARLT